VSQLLSIIALTVTLYALANYAGATRARAAIIAGALVGFAFPVRESIVNNQINLVTLVLATIAIVLAAQRPLMAGACAALGGVIKLYPFALLLEWVSARRWTALLSCIAMTAAMLGLFWTHWADYAGYLRDVRMADAYRHAGLHAVVVNTSRGVVQALGGGESWRSVASTAWLVSIALVAVWMVREAVSVEQDDRARRQVELSARAMAAVLLVFPLAWTHHYVFALPLVVCRWATDMPPLRVVIGTALMLFIPAFDVYPLGVHRLVGLTLVLVR
jgi:alpha-1,2-mannosyltransferase